MESEELNGYFICVIKIRKKNDFLGWRGKEGPWEGRGLAPGHGQRGDGEIQAAAGPAASSPGPSLSLSWQVQPRTCI